MVFPPLNPFRLSGFPATELVPLEWFSRHRTFCSRCQHHLRSEPFVLEDSMGLDLVSSNQLTTSYEASSFTQALVLLPTRVPDFFSAPGPLDWTSQLLKGWQSISPTDRIGPGMASTDPARLLTFGIRASQHCTGLQADGQRSETGQTSGFRHRLDT